MSISRLVLTSEIFDEWIRLGLIPEEESSDGQGDEDPEWRLAKAAAEVAFRLNDHHGFDGGGSDA